MDVFSLLITLLCVGAGTALFLYSTTPALREHTWLSGVAREQTKLRDALRAHIAALRAKESALQWDVQTLLLAIDDLGLTPTELIDDPAMEALLFGEAPPRQVRPK